MTPRFAVKPGVRALGATAVITGLVVGAVSFAPENLGPLDGHDLPPTDLERVGIGDVAPDFRLASYSGDILSLSDYREQKNVVLVFYRGHW